METKTHCRCVQCSGEFVPDPRAAARQVTCGAPECQRARHAEQCRRWHASNKEATASHYEDVVVPFRKKQPDYQQRWRWVRRLREIREESGLLTGTLLAGLRALVARAEQLARRASDAVQTGVLAGEMLKRAVTAVQSTISALEQLEASQSELRDLGL